MLSFLSLSELWYQTEIKCAEHCTPPLAPRGVLRRAAQGYASASQWDRSRTAEPTAGRARPARASGPRKDVSTRDTSPARRSIHLQNKLFKQHSRQKPSEKSEERRGEVLQPKEILELLLNKTQRVHRRQRTHLFCKASKASETDIFPQPDTRH